MNYLMTLKEHLRLFWRSGEGVRLQVGKVLSRTSSERVATKIPEKIKSVGFVLGARLCHEHKVRATTNFSLRNGMAR
jgi:hypothetical protein